MLNLVASALVAIAASCTLTAFAILGTGLILLALCIAVAEAAGYRHPAQTERNGLFD